MSTPVVVTHPCALVHDGLRQIFSEIAAFGQCASHSRLSEGLEAYLRSLGSCIWLIGVERCRSTTVELVQRVVTTTPGVKAVILAAYQRPDDILAALKAGACGFLCQDIPGERLIKSLELMALGEMVVHPQFSWGQTAVGQIQANGELKDNRALQADSGESHLSRHSYSRSSSYSPERRDGALGRKSNGRCRQRPISPRDADPANAHGGRVEQSYRAQIGDYGVNREGAYEGHLAETSIAESYAGGHLGARSFQ